MMMSGWMDDQVKCFMGFVDCIDIGSQILRLWEDGNWIGVFLMKIWMGCVWIWI